MVNFSIERLIEGNFFNFLLLFVLVVGVLVKCDIAGKITAMKEAVAELVKQSDLKKEEAENTLEVIQKDMANLPAQLNEILKDAEATVEGYKQKTVEDIKETTERLEHNANKIIASEVKKATAELSKELSQNSINEATGKIRESLNENNEMHRKFIKDAINKLDEINI